MPHRMFALICLFAFCVNRGFVSCQCAAGSECENAAAGEDVAESANSEPVASATGPLAGSSSADYFGAGESVASCVDMLRQAWNADRMLRLKVLKSDNNDTLVNMRFGASSASEDHQHEVGRTFGLRRRMQLFLWLPISFKLGVIVTLLLVLTTMSLKTLILGFVILLLLLTHTNSHGKLWGAQKAPELSDFHRNVHIHVHTLPEDHQHQNYLEPWHGSSPAAVYHV